MMSWRALLVLAPVLTTGPALASALEAPTVKSNLQIVQERGGGCAELRAGRPGSAPVLIMTDVCHGWATISCLDMVMIKGSGVVEDQAMVLFTTENRSVDLVRIIDRSIAAVWRGHTHLHLQFGNPTCDGALHVPVWGSHLNAEGPARGFRGSVQIVGPTRYDVSIKPES